MASTFALVLSAALVFCLPGFAVAKLGGAHTPLALATSIACTAGISGFTAWLCGLIGIPFNIATAAIMWILTGATFAAWNAVSPRILTGRLVQPAGDDTSREVEPRWTLGVWIAITGCILGALSTSVRYLRWLEQGPFGLQNIPQTWDALMHANFIQFILDIGNASPLLAGQLTQPYAESADYYPSGMHSLIALWAELFRVPTITAFNVGAAVLIAFGSSIGAASLASVFLPRNDRLRYAAAGVAGASTFAFPGLFWAGLYGGGSPLFASVGIAGSVILAFIATSRDARYWPIAALSLLGLVQIHPSNASLVVVALASYWLASTLFHPATTRLIDTCRMALPGVVALLLFAPQAIAGQRLAAEVSSWANPTVETQNVLMAWARAALLHMPTQTWTATPAFAVPFTAIGVIGIVAPAFLRKLWWPALAWFIATAIASYAFHPEARLISFLAPLSGLHYNSPDRLIASASLLVAAGVGTAGALVIATVLRQASSYASERTAELALAGCMVVGLPALPLLTGDTGEYTVAMMERQEERILNGDQRAAYDWIATQPRAADGFVFGDPPSGYPWIYAYSGSRPVAAHYDPYLEGSEPEHLLSLLKNPDADHRQTQQLLDSLNINFLVETGPGFGEAAWTIEQTGELERVYTAGDTTVFAVKSHFTEDELALMRNH